MVKRMLIALSCAAVLAGCGGTTPGRANTPSPFAFATRTITPAGGTITVPNGPLSATVTFPANAIATTTQVTVTMFTAQGLPVSVQSVKRIQSIAPGSTIIGGLRVDDRGVPLLKPLQMSFSSGALASGAVARLAGSLNQSLFDDLDTATFASGAVSNDGNAAYVGPTIASPSAFYAFYQTAQPLPPPGLVVGIAGPTGVPGGTQATYTGVDQTPNGFPSFKQPQTMTFGLDTPALGTIVPATGVFTATTTNNVQGHVTAVDSANNLNGSLAIASLSNRPATLGDSVTYTGTLTQSVSNNAIGAVMQLPSPAPSSSPLLPQPVTQNERASVTETIVVASPNPAVFANPLPVTGTAIGLNAVEQDAFALQTVTTNTTSTLGYTTANTAGGMTTSVQLVQSVATDSNNATFETDLTPTSGLLAVLPETPGAFGPNDASETTIETDPGINPSGVGQSQPNDVRITNPDGSYNETQLAEIGIAQNTVTATAAPAPSAVYTIVNGQNPLQISFGAPVAASTTAPATIPITFMRSQRTTASAAIPLWYGSLTAPLFTESDTVHSVSAYDPRCTVPAAIGPPSTAVIETKNTIDPAFGNLETLSTTTYDVPGVGTVCSIFSDTVNTFYDYSLQEGPIILIVSFNASPLLTTTTTEVLSLKSASVAGAPVNAQALRRSSGLSSPRADALAGLGRAPILIARGRFLHEARLPRMRRAFAFAAAARHHGGFH